MIEQIISRAFMWMHLHPGLALLLLGAGALCWMSRRYVGRRERCWRLRDMRPGELIATGALVAIMVAGLLVRVGWL